MRLKTLNEHQRIANQWLKDFYVAAKSRNHKYSLRAFAKRLEVSPGRLSEYFSGARPLTLKQFDRFAKILGSSNTERARIKNILKGEVNFGTRQTKSKWPVEQINDETFSKISDWFYFAINALLWIQGEKWSIEHLAERLRAEVGAVRSAVQQLKELGLVDVRNNTCVALFENFYFIGNGFGVGARNHQLQLLDKAKMVVSNDLNPKTFSSVIFTCNEVDMTELRNDIRLFRRKLVKRLDSNAPGARPMALMIQFIPLDT